MTNEQIAGLAALLAAATPGPWFVAGARAYLAGGAE